MTKPHTPRKFDPAAAGANTPRLEHLALWSENIDDTAAFLDDALGWKRHPIVFGVDDDNETFGGMSLAFIDANGLWIEPVQPTTDGPGMEFLKAKGNGALVELDFAVDDFDKNIETMRAKGIELIGMDGKALKNRGLLSEWVMIDGKRGYGDELLSYLPFDVARGTSIELFWEFPNGVVLLRDKMVDGKMLTPASAARLNHVVVLAQDVEATARVYTDILGLNRLSKRDGAQRDWLEVGPTAHAWIEANDDGFLIEIVGPKTAGAKGAIKSLGDGLILELVVEVTDLDALYDRMKAKGVVMTAGDNLPLPRGEKSVAAGADRFAYFPREKSCGMRIMAFESRESSGRIARRAE